MNAEKELTPEQISDIRTAWYEAADLTYEELANKFGVAEKDIYKIVHTTFLNLNPEQFSDPDYQALSMNQASQIREMYASGANVTCTEIAEKYSLNPNLVINILLNHNFYNPEYLPEPRLDIMLELEAHFRDRLKERYGGLSLSHEDRANVVELIQKLEAQRKKEKSSDQLIRHIQFVRKANGCEQRRSIYALCLPQYPLGPVLILYDARTKSLVTALPPDAFLICSKVRKNGAMESKWLRRPTDYKSYKSFPESKI